MYMYFVEVPDIFVVPDVHLVHHRLIKLQKKTCKRHTFAREVNFPSDLAYAFKRTLREALLSGS
jgi:hypothetical protein